MPEPSATSAAPAPETLSYAAAADLAGVRAFVRSCASTLGLPDSRAELLALAVNELATNTIQHTDRGGTVRVWANPGQVVCDVVDTGARRPFGSMPAPDSERGRGLAIVERIVDDIATSAVSGGTQVRIWMNL